MPKDSQPDPEGIREKKAKGQTPLNGKIRTKTETQRKNPLRIMMYKQPCLCKKCAYRVKRGRRNVIQI